MIIQCEQCQTKFKLDDAKVTDKGVKVRCAKCKHVFTVRREAPELEAAPDFGQEETVVFSAPPRQEEPPAAAEPSPSFDFGEVPSAESDSTLSEPSPTFDFSETPADSGTSENSAGFEINSFDAPAGPAFGGTDEFSLSSLEDDKGFSTAADDHFTPADDMDFGGIDFGDSDKTMLAPPPAAPADDADKTMIQPAVPKAEPQGLDFSDDSMFGAVVAPAAEEQDTAISFDFPVDDFADSMGAASKGSVSAVSLENSSDAPFSLGEIDFGDELTSVAVQQVNPEELKPAQELLFAPLAQAQEKPEIDLGDDTLKRAFLGAETTEAPQEELPPLSISSRRKQSPLFTGLIATVAIAAVGALGYVGYNSFAPAKSAAKPESGKISVRSVKAAYLKNKQSGELLVISGEAVNQFTQPRAALQVKGMVYDAKGQVLTSKSAYCGNQLSNEQLADMPLDKIEAAMTNQFGDSLANLEVAPGKGVPFVIVISNPPKEGKDYGVEPAGSTVASGKQP